MVVQNGARGVRKPAPHPTLARYTANWLGIFTEETVFFGETL